MDNGGQSVKLDLNTLNAKLVAQSSPPSPPATRQVPGAQQSTFAAPSNNQSCPNYHLWAPGAIFSRRPLPSINTNPVFPNDSRGDVSNTTANGMSVNGEASEMQMPLSVASYRLAMPNGQRFWEMPFFPISYGLDFGDESTSPEYRHVESLQLRRVQQEQTIQETDRQMTTLNELGFEFVTEEALGEGGGFAMRVGDGRGGGGSGNATEDRQDVDVAMNWEGRDGWEDIGGEYVTEENFINWFGVGS